VSLAWQIRNSNGYSVNVVWWVVGGTASGGPLVVPANTTINFETPLDGPLPNTVALMWIDPADGSVKTVSTPNTGVACPDVTAITPTPSPTSGVLIPVTGIDLPDLLRNSMLLNLGIGVFGFALILLGIGIKVDRDRWNNKDDD
jgi:hypothetical protein